MRIAIVTATRPHPGGAVHHMNNLAYGVKKLGHDPDIISIFETAYQIRIQAVDEKLGKFMEGKNKNWLSFLAWQAVSTIIFFRFLINYLVKKYDFVYVTDIVAANAIRPLEKLFKIPIILNPIDSVYSGLVSKKMAKPGSWFVRYAMKQEKKAYLKARAMLSIGLDMSAYFQKMAGQEIEIPVHPIPVNGQKYYFDIAEGERVRQKLGLAGRFVVLYTGRLSPEKGAIYLARSISEILKREPQTNVLVAIAGPAGVEKDRLIKYLKENQLEQYSRMLGFIADEDMRGLYNLADVFCGPAITFEGEDIAYLQTGEKAEEQKHDYSVSTSNVTVLEAKACGTPVIATDIPGSNELVQNNIDGLLVRQKDPAAIAEAILKLKNDLELRKKLSQGALESIKEILPDANSQFLIDYYRLIFNRP